MLLSMCLSERQSHDSYSAAQIFHDYRLEDFEDLEEQDNDPSNACEDFLLAQC